MIRIVAEILGSAGIVILLSVITVSDVIAMNNNRRAKRRRKWAMSRRRKAAELRLAVRRSSDSLGQQSPKDKHIRIVCKDPILIPIFEGVAK